MSFSVHRPKNGTLVPNPTQHFKRYGEALFLAFRTFLREKRYAVRLHGTQRTLSKRTTVPFQKVRGTFFWYAVRFSVAIVVPFIAAYKVYESYTCSIFSTRGCFWYAYTVFRMRPFNGTLYCISYACTVFRIASVFGTHTVFGT